VLAELVRFRDIPPFRKKKRRKDGAPKELT
jgi:hypothetical protein